jgi:alpha-L-arabinofuranosidase
MLRKKAGRNQARRTECTRRICVEALEDRCLPSQVNWISTSSGSWNTPGNWSTKSLPGPSDDVVISQPGNIQITLSSSTAVNSISISGDTLDITGGTLSVAANSSLDSTSTLSLNGGNFALAGGATLSNNGAITVQPGDQLSLAGNYTQSSTGSLTLPPAGLTTGVGTNLVSNSGFESPTASGSMTRPGSWYYWGSSYLSTQYAHAGSQSLQAYGPNSGVGESFSVTPSVSYTATVYAMTPADNPLTGPEGAFLQIIYYDASGNQISPYSPPNSVTILTSQSLPGGPIPGSVGSQGWNYFTTTAVAPSNAASVSFVLETGAYTGFPGTAGGAVFWDDAEFGPTAPNSAIVGAANLSNSGTMTIGAGDVVNVSGTFAQAGTGTLAVQLGGPPAGGLYGALNVGGSATLNGALQAELVNGYSPSVNDGFRVSNYASASGTFSSYQLPSGSGFVFDSALNPAYVGLSAVPTHISATVDAATVVNPASTNMLGVNLTWWDDKLTTSNTQQLIQAAGLQAYRFPGGSSSDDYHFNVAANFGDSVADTIPQFAQLIETAGGTGLVTLDYGSGSPQEAAAELAYLEGSPNDQTSIGTGIEWNDSTSQWQNVNWQTVGYWASLRAAAPLKIDDGLNFLRIDHAAAFSGIKFWEVGNEEYGGWEVDHHGTPGPAGVGTGAQHDPATYASFAETFASHASEIDPNIVIGIDSGDPNGGYNNWTGNVLTDGLNIGFVPGFISDHSYRQGPGSESDSTLLLDTVSDPNSVLDWSTRHADYENLLQSTLGSKASSVTVMATEFNSVYSNPGKQTTSLVNGLFIADSIGSLLDSGYTGGFVWDLRNGWDPNENNSPSLYGWREGGDYGLLGDPNDSSPPSTGPYVTYPNYFAEQLASKIVQDGGQVLSATSNYQDLSVYAVGEANGHLALLVINKNPDAGLTEQFNFTGFQPSGQAQVWQYGEVQDYAQSQSSDGSSSLANSTASLTLDGSSFSYAFPAYSMTVLDLTPSLTSAIAGPADGYHGVTGQTRTYTLSATPPAFLTDETFTYKVNWGDGQSSAIGPGAGSSVNASHVYATPGSYTVSFTVTDQNGIASPAMTTTANILRDELQGTTLAIGGTTGNDRFVFNGKAPGQWSVSLNGTKLGTFQPGSFMIYDNGGSDTVTVNGTGKGDSFTIDPSDAVVDGLTISADSTVSWHLNGIAGNNTFTDDPGGAATINGGTGVNTLLGPNSANTWQITGANQGKLNSKASFSNIENLIGGTASNTFRFLTGGSLLGTISGGGTNILDYTSYTTPMTVDLATGSATAVQGGVQNIEIVAGGSGSDTLTAGSGNEILIGGSGNDVLTGGDGRAILIAGLGSDQLTGGSGDDILIAGTTKYDKNYTALEAILAEWARTDETYIQRVDNIHGFTTGGLNGTYYLKSGSITESSGPDTLTGGSGNDWFWANLTVDTIVNKRKGERVN